MQRPVLDRVILSCLMPVSVTTISRSGGSCGFMVRDVDAFGKPKNDRESSLDLAFRHVG